ncbi:MAG: ABC transporter permease subunit/CPBP intramembrane protease [Thermoguttaceae bacterium]|jgi:sodium transport system permease protein
MTLSNVRLILAREIRDQMRDRRTLFMIVVLPILLYPLLGASFFQLAQFLQAHPSRVLIVSAKELGNLPPLFENQQFAAQLFTDPDRADLLELHFAPDEPRGNIADKTDPLEDARRQVQAGQYDAALYFPPNFAERLGYFQQAIQERVRNPQGQNVTAAQENLLSMPKPEIIYSTANEKSQIAFTRLSEVLRQWTELIGKENLEAGGLPIETVRPFTLDSSDVARDSSFRGAAVWAKIMPMLLLLWTLTGAFYPAVDLCAGEKERGTLETLLSSPAQRSEIVLGKLLTIMLFSMVTAVLNLISVGFTMWVSLGHFKVLGPPPLLSAVWLLAALVPISALFSALCLALAAFARSTKEGQYYLMPLLLVTMPLVILPMSPGMELNLGNSLIPITGVMLLLRSLLEGHYLPALQYSPVVIGVTLAACMLAIRWAVDQFNSESVLFRESELLDLGLWLRHLLRDRKATPSVAVAVVCFIVILLVKYFLSFSMILPNDFNDFARMELITQLVVFLTPILLMTVVLTSNPLKTLLLNIPKWRTIPAALMLAVFLHPLANVLQSAFTQLYPVSEEMKNSLDKFSQILNQAGIWQLLLVIAFLPAICEELAFRGFILSGFRHIGRKWRAIVITACFFGVVHGIIQQSLLACLLGVVLGFLAVQSGSILPCIVFHLTHNSLALLNSRLTPAMFENISGMGSLIVPGKNGGCTYTWSVVIFGALAGLSIMVWFGLLPYRKTPEEALQQAIASGEPPVAEDEDISASLASLLE